jgi:hypothetical protein
MRWPPYLLKFGFHNGRHYFGLWIPLFLIGPVVLVCLLAIFIMLLPFAFLALVFTWRWDWLNWVVMGIPAIGRVLCSLPGVRVDVDAADTKVNIAVY